MNEEKRVYEKKRAVAELFGGVCSCCPKKYGRGFTFHHRRYVFGELTYKDFKNTVKYNAYILPRVIKDPNRFMLVCSPCHTKITRLRRHGRLNLMKLFLAVLLTE